VGIDPNAERRAMAARFGASVTINPTACNAVEELKRLTQGRGVDVAIEALGRQETFESALRAIRPGGVLSSLGVYSGKLVAPYDAIYAGLADQRIVTTLCPGGKERMRRLMMLVATERIDLTPLVTHRFALADLRDAYDVFSQQREQVMKVAIYPQGVPANTRAALQTASAGH
jgi:threonine dehydrogenase-like Zn-dependent dehydrogenase